MSEADEKEPSLPPAEAAELMAALVAAARPRELDPRVHERLLAEALEAPLAPPTEAELVESERLRNALESGGAHPDADVLRALGAAFSVADDAAVERALSAAERARPRSNVFFVWFGAASAVVAAAAAVALFVAGSSTAEAPIARAAEELVRVRSTAELFDAPFETSGTTARMDRIAAARGRELRENRYAAWGVK